MSYLEKDLLADWLELAPPPNFWKFGPYISFRLNAKSKFPNIPTLPEKVQLSCCY